MVRKHLFLSMISLMVATAAIVMGDVSVVVGSTSQASQPASGCLPTHTGKHSFTLGQVKRCAPEATVVAAGTELTKPGRYAIKLAGGGYALAGIGFRSLAKSGGLVDGLAASCWAGGTFREIYSWEYVGDGYLGQDTGNCVSWGWRVYNIWNSVGCSDPIASCPHQEFTINNWGHWMQNGTNVQFRYYWGGEIDNYCRQNLNDRFGSGWWCG